MLELLPMTAGFDDLRGAGKGLLSLALLDARNHTLRWIAIYEQWLGPMNFAVPPAAEVTPPLWLLGHVGWYQERWIPRNVQRHRGEAADPAVPRLASIEPNSDRWYDPANAPPDSRWLLDLPSVLSTKRYLLDTLEIAMDLLELIEGDDANLYFYRLALFREDLVAERLAQMAQTLGLPHPYLPSIRLRPECAERDPVLFGATRWVLGSANGPALGGFAFDNEKAAHEIDIPSFEIDAQPVSWAQYAEFVEDGGYDEPSWWTPAGWIWKEREHRRAPRYVDKMRHGVLQRKFGRSVSVDMSHPVEHVCLYEAQAWCRWAGRRLPTEAEWEMAASTGGRTGFQWGEVWEWTSSAFEPYPGFVLGPDRDYSQRAFGSHQVLRGASVAACERLKHARFRNFQLPHQDQMFCGFRSCAM
jgi:ergothioneine biosynthesis protein EgtB